MFFPEGVWLARGFHSHKHEVNILIAVTTLNVFGVFGGFSLTASFPGLIHLKLDRLLPSGGKPVALCFLLPCLLCDGLKFTGLD